MKLLRKQYAQTVSNIIWTLERLFFYPKLGAAYRNLSHLDDLTHESIIVFDVGANKGQSIRFFKSIYPQSTIFAFEPSKKTFRRLDAFIQERMYNQVSIFQIGIGEIPGPTYFYESILDETSTFILPDEDSRYLKNKNRILFQENKNSFSTVTANITTIDEFIKKNKIMHIDILKIDVEGFELEVIRGARNAIMKSKIGIIQLEKHCDDMRQDRHPIIHEMLIKNGFQLMREIKHPIGNFYEVLYQCNKAAS